MPDTTTSGGAGAERSGLPDRPAARAATVVGSRRARRPAALLAAVALVALGAACGTVDPPVNPPNYVALGDSYTAGPLILPQSLDPLGCLRSGRNYPHLVAPATGMELRDVSCSGATTDDMTEPQGVTPGPNAPQFDALDASTAIVTLGIGGNDIGFSGIIEDCVAVLPFGSPCTDLYTGGGHDVLAARIAATAPKVASVLDGIRDRAPNARVFVVGYPAILPEDGHGCWPVLPLAWDDIDYLRGVEKALNAMLAATAAAHGAEFVDTYAPSIGHDACRAPGTRWVEPIVPLTDAAPVHPNAAGEQGMADVVEARMQQAGVL